MKRLLSIFLSIVCIWLCGPSAIQVNALDYWPEGIPVESSCAIIMEQETGLILYEHNINEKRYPASITKIMTALLVLENVEDLSAELTFSKDAVFKQEKGSSSIARDVGEIMTVEWTLYGMMLESANECAWALGEYVSGDMDSFVNLMNKRALELGCQNTHFANPNGLPNPDHYTSVYDMALICRAAYAIPKFREIIGTSTASIPPTNKHDVPTPLNNHHKMLHYYKTKKYIYPYCKGGKTGYTIDAGSTLATYAEKDGMTLICVIMGAKDPAHWTDTTNLFNYCFDNFYVIPATQAEALTTESRSLKTGFLAEDIELMRVGDEGILVLPKTATVNDVSASVRAASSIKDPGLIGRIIYTYADKEVGFGSVKFDSDKLTGYSWDNLSLEEGGSGKEVVTINPMDYIHIPIIVLAIGLFILLLVKKVPDLIELRYRIASRKKEDRTEYKQINRRGNRKR